MTARTAARPRTHRTATDAPHGRGHTAPPRTHRTRRPWLTRHRSKTIPGSDLWIRSLDPISRSDLWTLRVGVALVWDPHGPCGMHVCHVHVERDHTVVRETAGRQARNPRARCATHRTRPWAVALGEAGARRAGACGVTGSDPDPRARCGAAGDCGFWLWVGCRGCHVRGLY